MAPGSSFSQCCPLISWHNYMLKLCLSLSYNSESYAGRYKLGNGARSWDPLNLAPELPPQFMSAQCLSNQHVPKLGSVGLCCLQSKIVTDMEASFYCRLPLQHFSSTDRSNKLSTYCVPATAPGARDTPVNKTGKNPLPSGKYSLTLLFAHKSTYLF